MATPPAVTEARDAEPERALSADERARGRRLVYASHPLGMTHNRVFTQELPTLALLALGAGAAAVGLQRSLESLLQVLRLPTLRATARWPMRRILLAGQIVAVAFGTPLVFFGLLADLAPPTGLVVAMTSLALGCAALAIAQTVWFPLLYHYPEVGQTGRFFGIVRSGWYATLIAYFLVAQRWLRVHPGAFGALFGVGWLCGAIRIGLLSQLPEPARAADAPAVVVAWRAPFRDPRFRGYLAAMGLGSAARRAAAPFAIVVLRRYLGLTDADLVVTTVATYAGGLVSLYAWGVAADRFGTRPVFWITSVGGAAATLGLLALPFAGAHVLALGTFLFFVQSICTAGFEVADTNLLFGIAPPGEPTATLVSASVAINALNGVTPFAAGLALEAAVHAGLAPLPSYGAFFALCAALQLAALGPLRAAERRGA